MGFTDVAVFSKAAKRRLGCEPGADSSCVDRNVGPGSYGRDDGPDVPELVYLSHYHRKPLR